MTATNDTRLMERQLLTTMFPVRPPRNRVEQLVQIGESFYYGRMFLGHLYEAGLAFKSLDSSAKTWVTNVTRPVAKAQAALEHLRATFGGKKDEGFFGLLGKIRNLAAFHYKDAPFRLALGSIGGTSLIVAELPGFSRYAVTDALVEVPIKTAAKNMGFEWDEATDRAVDLGWHLELVVWRLVPAYLSERPGTWSLDVVAKLPVPPALRQRALAKRRAGALRPAKR
jgi:hypothetical protein